MNLKIKESAEYFDLYSAQGHIMARIPKNITDLSMTVSIFSHSLAYLTIVRHYAVNGHTSVTKAMADYALVSTKEVEQKYAEAFNN